MSDGADPVTDIGLGAQTIISPSGERLIVLSEAKFRELVDAAEDAGDREAVAAFSERLQVGDEELVPSGIVDRILAGENPVAVWRGHRGLASKALADRAGIAQGFLSQIETGKRQGSLDTMKKIAAALRVSLDDLV